MILKIIVIIVTICFLYLRTRLRKMSSRSRKRKADEKSENTPPQCSFGEFMESTWHRNLKPSTTSLSEFGEDEQTIFKMRAGIMLTDESVVNICRYYQLHLRDYFEKKQTRCCDIFQKHKKKKAVCSKNINLEMAEMLRSKGHSVVLGWKFCHHCDEAAKKMEESSREENQIDDENVDKCQ